jgi:eukaryotic-like serine/threonine-protein kinase
LAALHQAVDTDPVLQELAQTPLMLNIMSLASQGVDGNELARQTGDSEERRKQIFRLYVDQMFQRKGTTSLVFPKENIVGWLSWLAGKMREHSQSDFLVEGLQPSWLGTRGKRVAYGTIVALSLGLLFGLIFGLVSDRLGFALNVWLSILVGVGLGCWSTSPLKSGIISGSIGGLLFRPGNGPSSENSGLDHALIGKLIFGLIFGLLGGLGVGSLTHIKLVETVSWQWSQFRKRTIPGLIVGLTVGVIFALMVGLNYGQRLGGSSGEGFGLGVGLGLALIVGLPLGLIGGLLSGLIGGFTDRVKVDKASPNQGIKLSLKNSLIPFLVNWLTVGLIVGLSGRLIGGSNVLEVGVLVGLIIGVIGGLNRGGSAVIKHYALRLILWRSRHTPFNFVKFLDQCAKLILLKKVGGGYIFVHRMLLDYFADLNPQSARAEKEKLGSVAL